MDKGGADTGGAIALMSATGSFAWDSGSLGEFFVCME